ncbi:metabotropic glutamate receptor-like isoform X2 [Ceratitis capitata]|uniref:metabotropic glutamate receptor-like isoform X2 n=1 Tax=Ceratitis capitata TaxID=7213 RepID=UPI000C6C51BC|nr:metabotropic glutamate receptor-like isoform X2 [Ceratitis capitata]
MLLWVKSKIISSAQKLHLYSIREIFHILIILSIEIQILCGAERKETASFTYMDTAEVPIILKDIQSKCSAEFVTTTTTDKNQINSNNNFRSTIYTGLTSTPSSQDMISVILPGDIILGGLFPVHEKGEGVPCGPKVYNRGVHRLEAMLYAIDRVNDDSTLLPDITLGVHILDTCSRDTYALNQSLQFVRSSLNNLDASAFECTDASVPHLRKNASSGPVFGVIGGSYSSVSLQVANLLRLFHIPQISPASTAKTLSDKTRFDLFARTVPPDTFQSIALVDIIKCLNWSYVSTIHSEGSYGEYGIEAFHKEASERNLCIAASEKVPSAADDKIFDSIIAKLQKKPSARGVVLFTRAEDARRVLLAAKRANLSHPFHWIASDGWGKQQKLLVGLEDIAEGAITVELQSEIIEDFDRYMTQLTPLTNTRNPWFEEYWEDTFNCVLSKNYIPSNLQKHDISMQKTKRLASNHNNDFKLYASSTINNHSRLCDESLRLSDKVGNGQLNRITALSPKKSRRSPERNSSGNSLKNHRGILHYTPHPHTQRL